MIKILHLFFIKCFDSMQKRLFAGACAFAGLLHLFVALTESLVLELLGY